jgi:hypothetical protein
MSSLHHASIRTLLAVGATLAAALATPGSAIANRHAGRTKPVDVTFTDKKGPQIDRTDCASQPGVCELYYHGSGTLSGDAAGTATYAGHAHYQPDGSLTYTQVVHPMETRDVCGGAGTFRFNEDNVLSPLDPPQLGLAGIGTWEIIPHSGTGALKGATGAGYIVVILHDGVRARFLGAITCRHGGPRARHHRWAQAVH